MYQNACYGWLEDQILSDRTVVEQLDRDKSAPKVKRLSRFAIAQNFPPCEAFEQTP